MQVRDARANSASWGRSNLRPVSSGPPESVWGLRLWLEVLGEPVPEDEGASCDLDGWQSPFGPWLSEQVGGAGRDAEVPGDLSDGHQLGVVVQGLRFVFHAPPRDTATPEAHLPVLRNSTQDCGRWSLEAAAITSRRDRVHLPLWRQRRHPTQVRQDLQLCLDVFRSDTGQGPEGAR